MRSTYLGTSWMVTPLGKSPATSSGFTLGTTMQEPPDCQSAGVATFFSAVNWRESITRKISSKFLPVVAGYKMDSLSLLKENSISRKKFESFLSNSITVWKLRKFTVTLFWQFRESNAFTKENTKELIWRMGDSKLFIFPHCVLKTHFSFTKKNLSWNQLSCNLFSKTITFTKFCEREFLQFPFHTAEKY